MYGFLLLLFTSKRFSLITPFHVDNKIAVIFVKAVSLHFIQELRKMPFLQNLHSLFYSETRANVPFRQFLSSYLGWVLQYAFHFFQLFPPGLSTDLRSYSNASAVLLENLIEPFDFSWKWKADLHIDDITAMNLLWIYLHNELILLNTIDGFLWASKAQ